jgi:uncharacterized integral membrane protein
MTFLWVAGHIVSWKLTYISEALTASIIIIIISLVIYAVNTYETLVNFYETAWPTSQGNVIVIPADVRIRNRT